MSLRCLSQRTNFMKYLRNSAWPPIAKHFIWPEVCWNATNSCYHHIPILRTTLSWFKYKKTVLSKFVSLPRVLQLLLQKSRSKMCVNPLKHDGFGMVWWPLTMHKIEMIDPPAKTKQFQNRTCDYQFIHITHKL